LAKVSNPRAGYSRTRVTEYGDILETIGGSNFDIANINVDKLIADAVRSTMVAIHDEAFLLEQELELIQRVQNDLEKDRIVEKYVVERVIENLTGVVLNYIKAKTVEAMVETIEYNTPQYIAHMLTALELNQNNLVQVTFENYRVRVSLNFFALGEPETWLKAKRKATISGEYSELIGHMWEEKYYGVDREGNRILKTYVEVVDRGNKRKGIPRSYKKTTKDITHRYRGKYFETIQNRLYRIGVDQAPFWYFIEHGSNSIPGQSEPYPNFGGTNFIYATEIALNEYAGRLTRVYEEEVDKFLTDKYAKMIGLERVGPKLRQLLEQQDSDIARKIIDILENFEGGLIDPKYVKEIDKFTDDTNTTWALQQRGGTLQLTGRRRGQYVGAIGIND